MHFTKLDPNLTVSAAAEKMTKSDVCCEELMLNLKETVVLLYR